MNTIEKWCPKKLTELAEYINGHAFRPEDWGKDGLPIIRIEQLKNPLAPTDCFSGKLHSKQIIENGDLIFSWSASLFLRIWRHGSAALNQHLFKVIEKTGIDRLFLKLFIEFYLPALTKISHGSTMHHITRKELEKFSAPFPVSISEQAKIAEILSIIESSIEQTEALIAKQQRIKAGLMQDLLTRGIDEQGNLRTEQTHKFKDSSLGRIPIEWEVGGFETYVIDDAGIKPGPFGSSLTKDMYVQTGYRVFGQEQVIGGSLNLGDYYISEQKFAEMAGFSVRSGDVLISLVGTIGHILVVPRGHPPGIINPRLLRFRPDHRYCLPEFLKALLLSQSIRLQLDTFATGGTMPVISAGIIRKICTVIVGVTEQTKIIQILNETQKCIQASSENRDKLYSLKTALMQDLLTGKKRVTALLNAMEVSHV